MIPQGASIGDTVLDDRLETSATYKLDLTNNRIVGTTDRLEAVKQAVFKILQTERYRYFCYSDDYGAELQGLIGEAPSFVRSEMERRIREALMQDDRITGVTDFQFDVTEESAAIQFTVVTEFGSFGEEVNGRV
ncbi:DUF2634 domain-containing protein [Bacillus sp. FJAT-26390]|uniref:DUF2634 domain-containing protein n=1 Tax=Bacillus sp. FJAT-26390 TaxID=1743142 RepID=UPI000807FB4C|nr:DUF2634 domain-containing protein [Bacillus sp. FJAT-26390]OBZ08598.1 hypothetical protein A7975_26310 [Bacillus sp. FJAT-26390]